MVFVLRPDRNAVGEISASPSNCSWTNKLHKLWIFVVKLEQLLVHMEIWDSRVMKTPRLYDLVAHPDYPEQKIHPEGFGFFK